MDTNEANVQEEVQPPHQPQRKKCHGNRKDQRFRKKCRARGIKSEKIRKLLEKRKKVNHGQNGINVHARNMPGIETNTIPPNNNLIVEPIVQSILMAATAPANTHKRKRDESSQTGSNPTIPKSISSISIAQPTSKKTKPPMIRMPLVTMNDGRINKTYRFVFLLIE